MSRLNAKIYSKSLVMIIVAVNLIWAIPLFSAKPVPGPVTTVETYKGLPIFMIDGKPDLSQAFETYVPSVRHFRQFNEAGCRAYGFPTNSAAEPWEHSRPTWVGPGVWDYSEFDEFVNMVLEADPDALIMPRINVSEPDWWREAHPADLMVLSNGTTEVNNPYRLWPAKKSRTYPSIASEKWRQDMALSLRHMIEHIQKAPYAKHIMGYHIYGLATEEWYHYTSGRPAAEVGDYSDHMRIHFQKWLKRKYATVENLRQSWNNSTVTFATAELPTGPQRFAGAGKAAFRNPEKEMHVIDFYQCWNEIIPEVIDYFCQVAKEACNRTKTVGAFYAYMYEFAGNQESGMMGVQKLLQSPHVDYIVVTASYGQRLLGKGGSILRSPHTSLKLHDKLWYEDNDNVSYLFPEVSQRMGDAEWERSKVVLAATDTAEETNWIFQRGAGLTLGNGIYQSFFDLHGGYFDDPEIMAGVKQLYELFDRAVEEDRTSSSEILVVADELSTMYCTTRATLLGQSLYDPPYRLIKCGAPYDSVYVDDLALLDTSPYKLIIMLNTFHLTDEQVDLINFKLKRDNKTIFWICAPGLFQGNQTNVERMASVAGINLFQAKNPKMVKPRIRLRKKASGFTEELLAAGDKVLGSTNPASRLFFVRDDQAQILGIHPAAEKAVLAIKDCGNWRSVYSLTASLPPRFYRALARDAGVHIYSEKGDTLYCSQTYLTINADGAGTRSIRFPRKVSVYDALNEELLQADTDSLDLPMRNLETRILRLHR